MKRFLMSALAIVLGLGLLVTSYGTVLACHAGGVDVKVAACVPGQSGRSATITGLFNGGTDYRGTVKVDGVVKYGPTEYTGSDIDHNYSITDTFSVVNHSFVAI